MSLQSAEMSSLKDKLREEVEVKEVKKPKVEKKEVKKAK